MGSNTCALNRYEDILSDIDFKRYDEILYPHIDIDIDHNNTIKDQNRIYEHQQKLKFNSAKHIKQSNNSRSFNKHLKQSDKQLKQFK